ncbi:alpha/beta hydrolase family protein [Streptomyces platensis]
MEELVVIPAARSSRRGTRYRGVLRTHVAAVCCGLLLSGAAAAPAAAAPADHAPAQAQFTERGRGTLLSAEKLYTLATPQAVAAELGAAGFEGDTVRYGVVAYRLVYRTVDPYGRPTTASGLLALPLNREGRLRAVSFAHGTGSHKNDSPSMKRGAFVSAPVIAHAAAGAAGVAPDYLGMGKGPGVHPWMDIGSETTASLDMLRAARAFAPRTGHALEREVMVTGFSQGASAALGLGRALEAGADHWFRLGALAPVSGAYDFGGTWLSALHPTGPLAAALRTTGAVCTDWAPGAPVRLYMATGDEQAVTANTEHCQKALRKNGVDAPVIDLGAVDHQGSRHLGSNVAATSAIVRWFGELRRQ